MLMQKKVTSTNYDHIKELYHTQDFNIYYR